MTSAVIATRRAKKSNIKPPADGVCGLAGAFRIASRHPSRY
jgi:hypothetical protein